MTASMTTSMVDVCSELHSPRLSAAFDAFASFEASASRSILSTARPTAACFDTVDIVYILVER